jgi:hypothetical protein
VIKRNLAVVLVAGIVLGGGALALAQGPPERPSTGPAPAQAPGDHGKGPRGRGGPLGRAVHGDLVVPTEDGGYEKVAFDRGTVDAASDGAKVVINRPDGQKVTLELTQETRYRGVAGADQLRDGQLAVVTSKEGKALTVAQRDPARPGPGKGPGGGNKGRLPGVPND